VYNRMWIYLFVLTYFDCAVFCRTSTALIILHWSLLRYCVGPVLK